MLIFLPIGQLASVRSIVLLSALRKTLSLVVLLRIASQSGMSDQSTDTVDCGRKRSVNAYRSSFSAMTFKSRLRHQLWMSRFLLADISLEPRLSTAECHAFATKIGTSKTESQFDTVHSLPGSGTSRPTIVPFIEEWRMTRKLWSLLGVAELRQTSPSAAIDNF